MALITIKNAAINLDASEIPSLDASKITSGTFSDNRISASSVSQHAQSFDDNKIVNDISTLGLRVHTQENLNASNSNSASFDVFQDSSAISNLTNTTRDSDEFISSVSTSTSDASGLTINHSNYSTYFSSSTVDYRTSNSGYNFYQTGSDSTSTWSNIFGSSGEWNGNDQQSPYRIYKAHTFDFGANKSFLPTSISYYALGGQGSFADGALGGFNTRTTSPNLGVPSDKIVYHSYSSQTNNATVTTGTISGVSTYARYLYLHYNHTTTGNYSNLRALTFNGTLRTSTTTASATGSFTGNNITASSSTNKMGAVITYQDNAGTNALNTDIVLQLSADGGSNYSTATMTALPDFATGIKMAKVNDLSVTAGTSLKYKISFANQSAGSKEARIRGVSLQY